MKVWSQRERAGELSRATRSARATGVPRSQKVYETTMNTRNSHISPNFTHLCLLAEPVLFL